MDWTKAKNILIMALLITNLILGFIYFVDMRQGEVRRTNVMEDTVALLKSHGISISTDIPVFTKRMPVLFVRCEVRDQLENKTSYEEYSVESSGHVGLAVYPINFGDTKQKVIATTFALIQFMGSCEVNNAGI